MKNKLHITLKTIDHKKQRVGEVGDYWEKKGKTTMVISKMKWEYQALVMIHELAEYFLCKKRGITMKSIDNFDRRFYELGGRGEAGNAYTAPYKKEHKFASKVERMLAKELGVDFKKYEDAVDKL